MNAEEALQSAAPTATVSLIRDYLNKVYGWMSLSMVVTAVTAWYTAQNAETLEWAMEHPFLPLIGAIAILLVMNFGANAISASGLAILFMAFSLLEGIVLGPVLVLFTTASLALTFACTAGMFGAMALYGTFTKRNLSVMGRGLTMTLIGLFIALVANIFWGNGTMDLICSGVGVILFSLFTAYDSQAIIREGVCNVENARRKGAIFGAMRLYLDFLNLFLFLLRFLGRAND